MYLFIPTDLRIGKLDVLRQQVYFLANMVHDDVLQILLNRIEWRLHLFTERVHRQRVCLCGEMRSGDDL